MGEERLVQRVYRPTVEDPRGRERLKRRRRDEMIESLMGRGLSDPEAILLAWERKAWRRVMYESE